MSHDVAEIAAPASLADLGSAPSLPPTWNQFQQSQMQQSVGTKLMSEIQGLLGASSAYGTGALTARTREQR